jgi:heptosyltransferase-2
MFEGRNVVVSSITGIGSTLLVTPLLRQLRRQLPDAKLVLLTQRPPARDLLAGGDLADEIVVCDYPILRTWRDRASFVRWLRALEPAAFISTFPGNRVEKNLLAWLSTAPRRVGFHYHVDNLRNLGFLLTDRIPVDPDLHDVEQNLRLLQPLDLDTAQLSLDLEVFIPESDREKATEQLHQLGQGPIVGLHPGSDHEGVPYKSWAASRFVELGKQLVERWGVRIAVFGGPDERSLKQVVSDGIGSAASVVEGPITLAAAMIEQAKLFVTNDSGLMHLATALGVPTIALFGPTDPRRTRPYGSGHRIVRLGLDCSPCWRTETLGRAFHCSRGRPECIENIEVGRVLDEVSLIGVLESPEGRSSDS